MMGYQAIACDPEDAQGRKMVCSVPALSNSVHAYNVCALLPHQLTGASVQELQAIQLTLANPLFLLTAAPPSYDPKIKNHMRHVYLPCWYTCTQAAMCVGLQSIFWWVSDTKHYLVGRSRARVPVCDACAQSMSYGFTDVCFSPCTWHRTSLPLPFDCRSILFT